MTEPKQTVFISCSSEDDNYRLLFQEEFKDYFSSFTRNNTIKTNITGKEYKKKLLEEKIINNKVLFIILIGKNTWKRKYIDWEISAALDVKTEILPIYLPINSPQHPFLIKTETEQIIPLRLIDYIKLNSLKIYCWQEIIEDKNSIINISTGIKKPKINNNRKLYDTDIKDSEQEKIYSLHDMIDWKIIDQLHNSTKMFSTTSLELKKTMFVLIGIIIPTLIKLSNDKFDISIIISIYIISVSFWILDSFTYFNQEKMRELMDNRFENILRRNNNCIDINLTLNANRNTKRFIRSFFNTSQIIYMLLIIINTTLFFLYYFEKIGNK